MISIDIANWLQAAAIAGGFLGLAALIGAFAALALSAPEWPEMNLGERDVHKPGGGI